LHGLGHLYPNADIIEYLPKTIGLFIAGGYKATPLKEVQV